MPTTPLYASKFHVLTHEPPDLYVYRRTSSGWTDKETVAREFAGVEEALSAHDTRRSVLLIDVCDAPTGDPEIFVRISAAVRGRLIARFRRSAVLVATSHGAKQTTDLIIAGAEDCAVFRDVRAARHFLGL